MITDPEAKTSIPRVLVLLASVTVLLILGSAAIAGTVPCLTVSYAGEGTAENPYEVSNVEQLQCMNQNLNAHYEQVSDIDASETGSWNDGRGFLPVGPVPSMGRAFNGTYNGAGYKITNLTIKRRISGMERSDHPIIGEKGDGNIVGMFGNIGPKGKVTNVSLVNADVTGSDYVGALAGENEGTISRSYATGEVEGVEGGYFVGGLVGQSLATKQNSTTVIRKSYSMVNVTGSSPVGGLISESAGVEDTSNAIINESYAAGRVTGGRNPAGLVSAPNSSAINSYWDVNATGQNSSLAGTGLTTEQMTGEAARGNMTGFDFNDTWETVPGGYPRLSDTGEGAS